MAKPKIKAKEGSVAHGIVRGGRLTITTIGAHWQVLYPSRATAFAGDRLHEADTLCG
jgi:hypothetical protein